MGAVLQIVSKFYSFMIALFFCAGVFAADNRVVISTGQKDIVSMAELDPHEKISDYLQDITRQIYDTLYEMDENGNVNEGLVDHCDVTSFSEDIDANARMEILCTLKEGIYFHDGVQLRPYDVVFSIMRLKNSATLSSYLNIIRDVYTSGNGVKFVLRYDVSGLDDPQKWLFERFKRVMARYSYIVRADYFTGGAGWALEYPVGTGPFYFKDWKLWDSKDSRSQIILEKNKSYWKKDVPKIDQVLFRFLPPSLWQACLSKGTASLLFRIPYREYASLKKANKLKGDYRVLKRLIPSYQYLIFSPSSQIFKSWDIRKAFESSVNRAKIARNAFGRDVIINSGSALSASTGFPGKFLVREYSPDQSRKLVRAYMKARNIAGDRLRISILMPDAYEQNLVADELSKELYFAGFLPRIQKLSYASYGAAINKGVFGKFDIIMLSVNEEPDILTPRLRSMLKNGGIQLYQRFVFYALSRPEHDDFSRSITNFVPPVEGALILNDVE